MKLQKMNTGNYFVTVPKTMVHAKEWKKGDLLDFKIGSKGELILTKRQA